MLMSPVAVTSTMIPRFLSTSRISHRLAHSVTVDVGGSELQLKTGHMARFADGSVVASSGDNAMLATCVYRKSSTPSDGIPLMVDFKQSAAAIGRIPINYLRRELGQSDADILAGRVIDRSLRPMFPKEWGNDTQIICKPLSLDDNSDRLILGLNAAAASVLVAGIPLINPVAGVRVAMDGDRVVLQPNRDVLRHSPLDMVLSGCGDERVVMIEMEGDQISDDILQEAIDQGLKGIEKILMGMETLREKAGKPTAEIEPPGRDTALIEEIQSISGDRIEYVFTDLRHDKVSRDEAIKDILNDVVQSLGSKFSLQEITRIYYEIVKDVLRNLVIDQQFRCDGRSVTDFRPISIEVDVYKKLHGSALFQRGQTQVLSSVTFDSLDSAFHSDSISQLLGAQRRKTFMLHYEFPAYATNEIGSSRTASRRELGHGALAEKALKKVVPQDFPYAIRISSQVLESNGSSSMASVCSGSMAMYDAGVSLKAPVAGVAIGIVTDSTKPDEKYQILTDILGIEDYAGDMDFKVAGTKNGFTALQMDIKIPGITRSQLSEIIKRGTEGLDFVLDKMTLAISGPRDGFKPTVPVIESVLVEPFKKGILFKNNASIAKTIEAETGVKVSSEDDTNISMIAPNKEKMNAAKCLMNKLLNESVSEDYVFGQMLRVEVVELIARGALVRLRPGGSPVLIPNSQLSNVRINHSSAADITVGQQMIVQWLGRDSSGNIRLSRRTLSGTPDQIVNHNSKKRN